MSLPIGPAVPRRGNAFSRWLGRTTLRLLGWRLEGSIPNLPKMVMIGTPHTTNVDGVIAIATLIALGLRARTMIKDSAFKGLLGRFLLWAGAIPINRKSPKGVVEQSVDAFHNNEQLLLLLAPEGTRSAPEQFKRGFHLIARAAQVPILSAVIDYQRKVVTFAPPLFTTDDYQADLQVLLKFIAEHASPRHPHLLSKPLCEVMGRTWQPTKDAD